MIKNNDEFLTALKTLIGDKDDDNTLDLLEYATKNTNDINDELEKAKIKINELEKEKETLDKTWRERYKETFFNPSTKDQFILTKESNGNLNDDENKSFDESRDFDSLFSEIKDNKGGNINA